MIVAPPKKRTQKKAPPQPLDSYVTPIEIADALRVSKQTVYQLLRTGQLRWTAVLGLRRVKRSDLDAFLAKNSTI
jgi:excisionase family DNA binding protein